MADAQPRRGSRARPLLLVVLVFCLLGVITYLWGQLNMHSFYLVQKERSLIVSRGAAVPYMTRHFVPQNKQERVAYAPIDLPARWEGPAKMKFADRAELDRGIFNIVEEVLRQEFYGGRLPNMARVDAVMERVRHLTGLTDKDRQNFSTLEGDFAYLKTRQVIDGLPAQLQDARRMCDLAERQGSGQLGDPRQLSARLGRWLDLLARSDLTQPLPPAASGLGEITSPPPPVAPDKPGPGALPETSTLLVPVEPQTTTPDESGVDGTEAF